MTPETGLVGLWLVRHGESAGNVARQAAYEARADVIDIEQRDMDVPLSGLGERQAGALGRWLREIPEAELPTAVLCSPYVRAAQTGRIALDTCGGRLAGLPVRLDERLRDRDFGVLDRLTRRGIERRFPEQAELRRRLGKFYHRPPGGEAWTDVVLRLRSAYDGFHRRYPGQRLLVFSHDAVIVCFRYLIEGLNEAQALELSDREPIVNCSVTSYDYLGGEPELTRFNHVAPLEEEDAPVTTERESERSA